MTRPTRRSIAQHILLNAPAGKKMPEGIVKAASRKSRKGGRQAETGFVHGLLKLLNSLQGVCVSRNNIGQYKSQAGHWVRYGLFNPGGPDLFGWRSVVITEAMVGKKMAQAVGIECKQGDGKLSDAQSTVLRRLVDDGGLAFEARLEDGYSPVLERVRKVVN